MRQVNNQAHLNSFASYVPEKTIDNDMIMSQMGLESGGGLLYRAVGAKEKRVAEKHEMGADMLVKVGQIVLEQSGLNPDSIDKLICSCDPPDQAAPDTAVITQNRLGLTCPSFGVSMSCVGWICGINIANGFLTNGDEKILVLSASTVGSKFNFRNPMHRAIFGDGAGGCLVEKEKNGAEVLTVDLLTLGQYYKKIFASYRWSNVPEEIPSQYHDAFYMAPDNLVFFEALEKHVVPFYLKQYKAAGISADKISRFIIHQASMPLYMHTLEILNIPKEKTADHFSKFGNIISAELPLYLAEEIYAGRIKKNDYVYLLTYGAGFTVGAMILKF